MAHQGIPPQHRDPRGTAPHRSPHHPATRAGASHLAEEADDYAAGSAADYDWDEETHGGDGPVNGSTPDHRHGTDARRPGHRPARPRG